MYDFVIIGGGIIGMSTAMQLIDVYPDARIALLEKESGPACHQTGHNSGVIHAGVYYTPGSLKAQFCLAGNRATKAFCDQNGIRYDNCGKMLVATSDLEMERMRALWERTAANGIEREWLNADELREREPNITGLGGIFVPSSGIVSYREVTAAMAKIFQARGGEIIYNAEVSALSEHKNGVVIRTRQGGEYEASTLISCSGLMADRLVKMLGLEPGFIICPFRGEYFRLAPEHNQIVNHLIYPIPDPAMPFLGVHLTRMIDGSVTVGPNAVLAFKREGYRKRDFSFSDTLEILVTLVEAYEKGRYELPPPDPIQAIEYFIESRGWTRKELEPSIGSRGRVSEIMGRKRPLTITMIRNLERATGIPASILIQPYPTEQRQPNGAPVPPLSSDAVHRDVATAG